MSRILPDGTRRRARLFSGFLSHYLIRDRYGRPGKGNDKGAVEGLVGWARRNFMVPLPHFADFEALNRWLKERRREHQRAVPGAPFEVFERLGESPATAWARSHGAAQRRVTSACQKIDIYLNSRNKWRFKIAKSFHDR